VRLEHNRRVRARVHTTRAMRVLSHNAMFPLLSETYVHDEMMALAANGAEIAFNSVQVPGSPMTVDEPVSQDLFQAVQDFDPDVIFLYWATHARGELANLERVGRPFALRIHSFDFDPEAIAAIQAHPLCIGVWAYPHHVPALDGAHELVPLFTAHEQIKPTGDRDLAVSVSAGLPKKNWPLLVEAMDRITEYERGIVLARSNGLEWVPDHVVELAAALDDPPFVVVNAERSEVFELLGHTSVLLYTLDEGVTIGMPMSIVEAMRAGACVIHPDRPEMRHVTGPGFRGYRSVDDIVAHVHEIAAGGPEIEAERRRNEEWARSVFCDPKLGTVFHEELSAALEQWRYDVG
jgi:glycosyltransferase involved in cell wall biosynthesis